MCQPYSESLGVDAVLNHGNADGQRPAVQMAVLKGASVNVGEGSSIVEPDQDSRDFMEDINGLLGGCLFIAPFVCHFCRAMMAVETGESWTRFGSGQGGVACWEGSPNFLRHLIQHL